jgi:hypothetical protein
MSRAGDLVSLVLREIEDASQPTSCPDLNNRGRQIGARSFKNSAARTPAAAPNIT